MDNNSNLIIQETGRPNYPTVNYNTKKDIALKDLTISNAAKSFLEEFLKNYREVGKAVHEKEDYDTKVEELEKAIKFFDQRAHHFSLVHKEASESKLSSISLLKELKKSQDLQKSVLKKVIDVTNFVQDAPKPTRIQKFLKNFKISLKPKIQKQHEKRLKEEFTALLHMVNSNYQKGILSINSKYEVKTKDSKGNSLITKFDEQTLRSNPAKFLHKQAKEGFSTLSEEERKNYKKFAKDQAFRTSMESKYSGKRGPDPKGHLVINHWESRIRGEDGTKITFGRSGAYYDASNPKSDLLDNPPKLSEEELSSRKAKVKDMVAFSIASRAEALWEEMTNAKDEGKAHFALESGRFDFTQISLLTSKKADEYHMLRDMEWALKSGLINEIRYDGKTGLDDEGVLHISLELYQQGKPLSLEPHLNLFNFTVQTKPKEGDYQIALNKASMKELESQVKVYRGFLEKQLREAKEKSLFSEEALHDSLALSDRLKSLNLQWTEFQKKFSQNISNFDIAKDLASLQLLMTGQISINCKSGKDRTGKLAQEISSDFIEKTTQKKAGNITLNEKRKIARLASAQTMNNGPSLYITGMNTFVKGIKISPRKLSGLKLTGKIQNSVATFFVKT